MQEIGLHIEYLLRFHDCVIMPGIGAFIRNRQSARYFEEDGRLLPPSSSVCFNASIQDDDKLLAHSFAKCNEVTFEQGRIALKNALDECRHALHTDKELTIGRIGRLYMSVEGQISFVPFAPVSHSLLTPLETKASIRLLPDIKYPKEITDSEFIHFRISKKALRYAATIAILLASSLTLLIPSANRHVSMEGNGQFASVIPAVTTTQVQDLPSGEQTSDKTTIDDREHKYYLIVATFGKKEDCEAFISQHPEVEGLQTITHGKSSRVYCYAADTHDEVVAEMRSIPRENIFAQAWIWENPAF